MVPSKATEEKIVVYNDDVTVQDFKMFKNPVLLTNGVKLGKF